MNPAWRTIYKDILSWFSRKTYFQSKITRNGLLEVIGKITLNDRYGLLRPSLQSPIRTIGYGILRLIICKHS